MLNKKFLIFLLLGFVVFAIDLYTPRGTGLWALYIIVYVIYLNYQDSGNYYFLAAVFLFLSFIGYYFSDSKIFEHVVIVNRAASFLIILLVAYLAQKERKTRSINAEILDRISDSFIAVDKHWNITYLNKIAEAFGNTSREITGKNIWNIFSLKGTPQGNAMNESMRTQQPSQIRYKEPGTDIDYEINIYPSREGLSIYSRDVSELVKKEIQLRKTLAQKDMLLKEVHHRVKNNFQLISSIIRLSTFHIYNDEIIRMVNDIESRIKVLSLIHEQLYKGTEGSNVNMKNYISNLTAQLAGISNHNSTRLTYNIAVDNIELGVDAAISVGLIINELFSNSIKHGFKTRTEGTIIISMSFIEDHKLNLKYQDNGTGMEEGKTIHESDSMGFTIIKTIVEQSEGEIKVLSDNQGLKYDIVLDTSEHPVS